MSTQNSRTKSVKKSPARKRPTKKDVQRAKDAVEKAKHDAAARAMNRRHTINHLGEVSSEAAREQHNFIYDMFCLGLREKLGNARLNKELREIQKVFSEQKLINDTEICEICDGKKYIKTQAKVVKSVKKKLKKIYKKVSKKIGKKATRVLFSKSVPQFTELVGVYPNYVTKTFRKAQKALNKKHLEIEEDRKIVKEEIDKCSTECPKLAPEDLSIVDHSFIHGKKKVELPGDKMGTD